MSIDATLSSYSKITITGASILAIAFSIITETEKKFQVFGVSLSTEFAPLILSFIAMVIVFEEFRHIKTIDYLLEKSEDKEKVIFLIQTHPTILNPYFEIDKDIKKISNYFGITLIVLINMILLFVIEHLAFRSLSGGKVIITLKDIPFFLFILITGLLMITFLAKTIKKSLEHISEATSTIKVTIIYFLVPCIYMTNKLFFQ